MNNAPAEVSIEEFKDAAPAPDGDGVVLDTQAVVDGERRETTIEVSDADATAIAVALMSPDSASADVANDGLAPAMRCLAAGVIHTTSADLVRLHLQFDSGQVLPIELSPEAAQALGRGLVAHLAARSDQNAG